MCQRLRLIDVFSMIRNNNIDNNNLNKVKKNIESTTTPRTLINKKQIYVLYNVVFDVPLCGFYLPQFENF